MQKIMFSDWTLDQIAKETGLSKLELLGIIAVMNKHTLTSEQIKKRERESDMGL